MKCHDHEHSLPEAPIRRRDEQIETKRTPHETIDEQRKKNCIRRIALDLSVEKTTSWGWGGTGGGMREGRGKKKPSTSFIHAKHHLNSDADLN